MGKIKLFISPPPRAGPVQACPSQFTHFLSIELTVIPSRSYA